MQPRLVRRADLDAHAIAGTVLCHELRGPDRDASFRKGRILCANDLAALAALDWDELHLLALDDGDVHEAPAGERLARAAAGRGVTRSGESAGHWPIRSAHRGIVDVSVDALSAVNGIEGLCVYTLLSGHVVDAGETVAQAKITPFAVPESHLHEAESIAGEGLVHVRRFIPHRVGAVVQESLAHDATARFEHALGEKIRWFGSTPLAARFAPPRAQPIAEAVAAQLAAGAEIIVLAGTKALDPLDPGFQALAQLKATSIRHGAPAHPGSLFWMADLAGVPVLGMPTCGLFSEATVFDLVLPQVLTGSRVGRAELAMLGHGGYLTREMTYRFPPYRRTERRGAIEG